jgi:hypothetical protein
MEEPLNTWIYKRNHKGDPDESEIFGIHDCMGSDRGDRYDAVIGVGVKKPDHGSEKIALKINWIGINPCRRDASSPVWFDAKRDHWSKTFRGPLVTFERFVFLDEKGPIFKELAPNLFRHMFEDQQVRQLKSRSLLPKMQEEVQEILRWAENHQPRNHPSKFWQEGDFTATPPRVFQKKSSTKRKCKK